MQKSRIKKHLAAFASLVLLTIFPFVSCEKENPDNAGTENQETTENKQEGNTDPGKVLIVYYSYTGYCEEIVSAL